MYNFINSFDKTELEQLTQEKLANEQSSSGNTTAVKKEALHSEPYKISKPTYNKFASFAKKFKSKKCVHFKSNSINVSNIKQNSSKLNSSMQLSPRKGPKFNRSYSSRIAEATEFLNKRRATLVAKLTTSSKNLATRNSDFNRSATQLKGISRFNRKSSDTFKKLKFTSPIKC